MINSNKELLSRVASLLDDLSFQPGASRAEKWRTIDQLANELELFGSDAMSSLDQALREHEAQGIERMKLGELPERLVRRAKYPDRTTALSLWGSTKYHEQPWSETQHNRFDPPEDLPAKLIVAPGAPHVFLSHTHDDAFLAINLAEKLAEMSIGSWMFETKIEERGDIADCVRNALSETEALVLLLTRNSIASLWVLTELHTSLKVQKKVVLVVNANDSLLLQLLQSVKFQNPDADFDFGVTYNKDIVEILMQDYGLRQTQSRTDRYETQVHNFMATLPIYLGQLSSDNHRLWQSMLAFPQQPAQWSGFLRLDSMHEILRRLKYNPTLPKDA